MQAVGGEMASIRRECCDHCMWLGPVNKDGTMRKHRPATSEDRYGRKVQNRHEDHCKGSHKPYARFGNEAGSSQAPLVEEPPSPKVDITTGTCSCPRGEREVFIAHHRTVCEPSAVKDLTTASDTDPSLSDYAEASRIVQSLIPGVHR